MQLLQQVTSLVAVSCNLFDMSMTTQNMITIYTKQFNTVNTRLSLLDADSLHLTKIFLSLFLSDHEMCAISLAAETSLFSGTNREKASAYFIVIDIRNKTNNNCVKRKYLNVKTLWTKWLLAKYHKDVFKFVKVLYKYCWLLFGTKRSFLLFLNNT